MTSTVLKILTPTTADIAVSAGYAALDNQEPKITPTNWDFSTCSPLLLGGIALAGFVGMGMFLRKRY